NSVTQAGVIRRLEFGPRRAGMVCLTKRVGRSGDPILERIDSVDALRAADHSERVFSSLDDCLRVLPMRARNAQHSRNQCVAEEAANHDRGYRNSSDVPWLPGATNRVQRTAAFPPATPWDRD